MTRVFGLRRAAAWVFVLAALTGCAAPPADGPFGYRSLGSFSRLVAADSTGCEWTGIDGRPACAVVALIRDDGRSRWDFTLVRYAATGYESRRIVAYDGPDRFGAAALAERDGVGILAVSRYSEGAASIEIHVLDSVRLDAPAASVRVPGFVREADWRLVDLGESLWLVYAAGARLFAAEVRSVSPRVILSEPWELLASDRVVATPAFARDPSTGMIVAGWREFAADGRSTAHAGIVTGTTTGSTITRVGSASLGFSRPFVGAGSTGADYLGARVTFESRRSLAVHTDSERIWVASSAVTRQRSQLSEFHAVPRVFEFTVDDDGPAPVVRDVGEESPGVVDSFFRLIGSGRGVRVTFLREWPREPIRSDLYGAVVRSAGSAGISAVEAAVILETPRRITSPSPDGSGGVVWLQEEPARGGWQAGYQNRDYSYLADAGVVWRGHPGETAAALLVALPLSMLLALAWSFGSNALILGGCIVATAALFRYLPAVVREHYRSLVALLVLIPAALAGVPGIALGGPAPGLIVRLLGGALVSLIAARAAARSMRVPTPTDAVRWSVVTVVAMIATVAYPATLAAVAG